VHALRTRDWLLVRDRASRLEGVEPEIRLYRRLNGRALPEDVAVEHPDVFARLRARLDALYDSDDKSEAVAIPVPENMRQRLRALGYLPEE
jgi:hypothetical protein